MVMAGGSWLRMVPVAVAGLMSVVYRGLLSASCNVSGASVAASNRVVTAMVLVVSPGEKLNSPDEVM